MFNADMRIPQSVRDYLSNDKDSRGIRMSVDALLKQPLDSVPSSLAWDELECFYQARAAAELTKIEWAIAVKNLWEYVWGAKIGSQWQIRSIADLHKKQLISIEGCWAGREFIIAHDYRDFELYTVVHIEPDEITIGFSLEDCDTFFAKGDVDVFEWPDDESHTWHEWNSVTFAGNLLESPELIENARAAAEAAIDWCNDRILR